MASLPSFIWLQADKEVKLTFRRLEFADHLFVLLFDLFQVLQDGFHVINHLVLRLGVDLGMKIEVERLQ